MPGRYPSTCACLSASVAAAAFCWKPSFPVNGVSMASVSCVVELSLGVGVTAGTVAIRKTADSATGQTTSNATSDVIAVRLRACGRIPAHIERIIIID